MKKLSRSHLALLNQSVDPDPDKWVILREYQFGGNVAVWVKYINCTNYEGNKILVYEACTVDMLKKQGSLDPHFSNKKNYLSPVARFEPTERGWTWAVVWIECF